MTDLISPPPRQTQSIELRALYGWAVRLADLFNEQHGLALTLQGYTVATVPDATIYEGRLIYITDETGGSSPAFSDGTNWRRTTDRAIIS